MPVTPASTGPRLPAAVPPPHRLVFANQLRGLAALSVAVGHLVGVYWSERDLVARVTASPAQPGEPPAIFGLVSNPWFNPGPFGVAVFFLISGLVIPISLEHHARLRFLLARALRIYPTYLAALAVNLAAVWLASRHWDLPFIHNRVVIAANALLVQDLLQAPSIDLVNWSLAVELKFYLLMALLAPAVRRGSTAALLGLGLVALGLNVGLGPHVGSLPKVWRWLAKANLFAAPYLVFMLIGVAFSYRLRGQLSRIGLLAGVAALGALFAASWRYGPYGADFPGVAVNYAYALALFGALFALRRHVRAFRPLDALAAVSYPFYLVHSLVGYLLLRLLTMEAGIGYHAALAITVPAVLALAAGLHVTVERRSILWGKRLSARPRPTPAAPPIPAG